MKIARASIALLLVAGLSACGDDVKTKAKPTEEPRLTETQFVNQGNAICKQANNDIETKMFQSEEPETDEAKNQFMRDHLIPRWEQAIAELRELREPKDMTKAVDEVLDASVAINEQVKVNPAPLWDDTSPWPYDDVNVKFTALGLTVCAE